MKKALIIALLASVLTLSACGNTYPNNATSGTTPLSDTGSAAFPAATASANTVTVTGNETVKITPDIAEIVLSIQSAAADPSSCQQKNTEVVNAVTKQLTDLGIAETSIQTTGYYLDPQYDWSNNKQTLTGYQATTTLTVSDLPIDQVGDILTKSVGAGVNNIQSISYTSSQYDEQYAQAMKLAVEASRQKAQALAEAGGHTLGAVLSLQENSTNDYARYSNTSIAKEALASGAADQAAIMPGQVSIESNVTVVYQLQ